MLFAPAMAASSASRPAAPLAHLHHTAWTAKDGLPGLVEALAQTSDGYLWLGTVNGLMRFDGVRFESFESIAGDALPSKAIHALKTTSDNGLWVCYAEGEPRQL